MRVATKSPSRAFSQPVMNDPNQFLDWNKILEIAFMFKQIKREDQRSKATRLDEQSRYGKSVF